MTHGDEILSLTRCVLVVDWPSRDVPDSLALAGYDVVVRGGPESDNYSAYEALDGEVVVRRVGSPPDRAELVYSHRPLEELPGIVAVAEAIGAAAVWTQSGLSGEGVNDPAGCWVATDASLEARTLVEAAGFAYVDDEYIGDVARRRPEGGG